MGSDAAIMISFFFGISVLLLVIILIIRTGRNSTNAYTGFLNDLLVAGKLRQIATREKVDFEKEVKNYQDYVKLMRTIYRDNSGTVRDKINSKIKENLNEELIVK
jgi:hypothetical protein